MLHPETGEWVQAGFGSDLMVTSIPETYFIFIFYGMEFVINLGGPSVLGYEHWLLKNNHISPFMERNGVTLVEKKMNNKIQYFLFNYLVAIHCGSLNNKFNIG